MSKKRTSGVLKLFKVLSIVVSCATLFVGLFLVVTLDKHQEDIAIFETAYSMIQNMWVFFLLLPLTLGCLVYGIVLSVKKYKAVSNIVIGAVFSFLLVVYGSFSPVFKTLYNTSNTYWNDINETLEIGLPDDLRVLTMDYTRGVQETSDSFYLRYESVARFSSTQSFESFKNSLDGNWKSSYLNNTVPFTFSISASSGFDYYMIYSYADDAFNPSIIVSNSKYISIAFSDEKQGMYLCEYTSK